MINILGTLRFNVRAFGWRKGLRLPILVYGRIKAKHVGTIRISCPVRRGLVVIGVNHDTVPAPCSVFHNTGTVEICGKVYFNYGLVFQNSGTVVFHGSDLIGKQCVFDIRQRLDMGHDVSIGYETHITDSDDHFVVDVNTRRVQRNTVPVSIGNYNWFGSNCFIKKGTVTPDYLIVASPFSMLSKDYSSLPPNSVLAGCPAKLVKDGIRRVFSFLRECEIKDYFRTHPEDTFYQIDECVNLDEFCKLDR